MITAERIRGVKRAESDASRLLRSSKSLAARVRRETELTDRAWEEAAEATAAAMRMTKKS
jgi:hypothetical protein